MRKLILISLCFMGLSACSPHKNPLTVVDNKTAAIFLVKASLYAENKLKLDEHKNGFRNCKNDTLSVTQCEKLYTAMLEYARTQRLFHTLTKSDLTDATMWRSLNEYYQSVVFTWV